MDYLTEKYITNPENKTGIEFISKMLGGGGKQLLVDKKLKIIKVVNISGYNNNKICHFGSQREYTTKEVAKFDKNSWKEYQGTYEVENEKGINVDNLMKAVVMSKSCKFDNDREKFKKIESITQTKNSLTLTISFKHL